jgi:phenylalanyl-tRNA synthetase beta chain
VNVPESWLRSFCNPPVSGAELAERLTMAGLEVEAYEPYGPQFSGVVVGEVLAVEKHPNADKLTVCRVHDGSAQLQVVCGAPNVRAGMKAPLARVGAKLPGTQIKEAPLRGVNSQGMLASARELGLSDDHSGLLELPKEARPGADVRAVLGLEDNVLTLKLTPNRADALSLLGVAREVAALTGKPLEIPRIEASRPYRRAGRLRTVCRPCDPQGQRRRADAAMDESAPRAGGTAQHLRAGRRHQLRHARARPPAPRLRP